LENFLFQLHRNQHLDQLSFERFLRLEEESARKLHRDRRPALLMALLREVNPRRFRQAQKLTPPCWKKRRSQSQ